MPAEMDHLPTILIAEDDVTLAYMYQEMLAPHGPFRFLTALRGREALELARQEKPELLILDILLPELNGFEICQALKADPHTADIPVLMLTALQDGSSRVKGLELGAEDYLTKPFHHRELIARVRARLNAKYREDHLRELSRKVRETFVRYVAPAVVDRLLADPTHVVLGGQAQVATLLFADLRDYSALARHTPPEQLITILNDYLSAAAEAILVEEGTVNQYAGDEVMAIFNAPLSQPDHVLRAVRSALSICESGRKLQQRSLDHSSLSWGLGINTGLVVVGNVGTPQLMNYTAVGDPVNLAKRLEAQAQPMQTLVTRQSYELIADQVRAQYLGSIRLRGREDETEAYEIVGLR